MRPYPTSAAVNPSSSRGGAWPEGEVGLRAPTRRPRRRWCARRRGCRARAAARRCAGRRGRSVFGYVRHRHAASAGRGDVDDVDAGREHGDEAHCGSPAIVAASSTVLLVSTIAAPCRRGRRPDRWRAVVDGQLAERREVVPGIVAGIERVPVENDDAHGGGLRETRPGVNGTRRVPRPFGRRTAADPTANRLERAAPRRTRAARSAALHADRLDARGEKSPRWAWCCVGLWAPRGSTDRRLATRDVFCVTTAATHGRAQWLPRPDRQHAAGAPAQGVRADRLRDPRQVRVPQSGRRR